MPTILIAYANDTKGSLRVASESKDIQRLLDRVFNKDYKVKLLPEITTADLTDELMHIEQDLAIFHYCGHAHPGALQFTDKDADAPKLAERLRQCVNLKFVFLNGCQTKEQVRFFHKAGVPFILATSVKIKDDEAHWFATQFYKYLILENNAIAAFEKAKADAGLENRDIDLNLLRGITGFPDTDEDDFDWGLFVKEGVKPYHIPMKPYTLQAPPTVEHGRFLKNLLLALKDYQSPLNTNFLDTIETIETLGDADHETKYTDMLKILPYPIGIRLRQIYASDLKNWENEEQYYQELLHDYACFFETLLHYSFALMVSQLWQNQKLISHESVSDDFGTVRKLICSNRLTGDLKDYAQAIKSAHSIIGIIGIQHPIPRIADAFGYLDGDAFGEVSRYFDQQKDFFRSKIRLTTEEAVQQCYESQQHLEGAFRHFGFVIENVLASIRHINVINFRYVEEAYANEVWQLVASQDGSIRQKRFKKPMENKSVLCFSGQDLNPDTNSINLFPFFLDRSAFARPVGNVVDLYQFVGYFCDDWVKRRSVKPVDHPCYYFMSLNNPDRIWRFNELDFSNATTSHIDEPLEDSKRQSQMLTVAGELNNYFEQFKSFLNPKTPKQ